MSRTRPNILITGTPGTGKSTTASEVANATGFKYIEVGALVKERELHSGRNEEFDTLMVDEDKVVDELEDVLSQGGNVVDYHSCDFFPERWFDLVVVLRCDNTVLYPRLQERGYNDRKLQENIECEIMQVVLEEARDSYKPEIVMELGSNTVEEMEHNVENISRWIMANSSQ
mmetsp:Transcript_6010/g.6869  ORF Transcript_6010/g.6869 Transcript_6010/m.6869 type:complete len:172 (-) Transcript_6010:66-581(-)|eukprot:CAMPEP_0197866928 /NCGR_PEP_ID=MMETSP1438-20131217/44483_1 /TAXON_ID=1461541 /ORGANISM="Pterosperma sp., Strain CCMP1384" /LENGTH=171 /DNA_ID=CAMNT_0043485539 /DNA_START=173 /DNA_END=688 /DNA_ORIENTATION=-